MKTLTCFPSESLGLYMREAESLCAKNIGLKDIVRSRRGRVIFQGELIMYQQF